tara:strand:+ start:1610 stop:1822 length:213 start_codon:yes stop_codon:yes gene_type:complete
MKPPMTPEEIKIASMARFAVQAAKKWDSGLKEHKTVLTETVTLEMLEDEIIDSWHYVQSLRLRRDRDKNG